MAVGAGEGTRGETSLWVGGILWDHMHPTDRGWGQSTQPRTAPTRRLNTIQMLWNEPEYISYGKLPGLIIIKICTSDPPPGKAFQAAGGHMSTPGRDGGPYSSRTWDLPTEWGELRSPMV